MGVAAERVEGRANRHRRIRRVVRGSVERPRLVVFRSMKHIYAQVVDDTGHGRGGREPVARAQGHAALRAATWRPPRRWAS